MDLEAGFWFVVLVYFIIICHELPRGIKLYSHCPSSPNKRTASNKNSKDPKFVRTSCKMKVLCPPELTVRVALTNEIPPHSVCHPAEHWLFPGLTARLQA